MEALRLLVVWLLFGICSALKLSASVTACQTNHRKSQLKTKAFTKFATHKLRFAVWDHFLSCLFWQVSPIKSNAVLVTPEDKSCQSPAGLANLSAILKWHLFEKRDAANICDLLTPPVRVSAGLHQWELQVDSDFHQQAKGMKAFKQTNFFSFWTLLHIWKTDKMIGKVTTRHCEHQYLLLQYDHTVTLSLSVSMHVAGDDMKSQIWKISKVNFSLLLQSKIFSPLWLKF